MITQARSTRAILPCSQLPATSAAAAPSGRNSERIPCVSHFSGKTAATCCIHPGSSEKAKKTPEKNFSTIAKAAMAVPTEAAVPRSAEAAMSNTVPARQPSAATHTNVTQSAGAAGSGNVVAVAGHRQQDGKLHDGGDQHLAGLAGEVGHRRGAQQLQPLELTGAALAGDRGPDRVEAAEHDPGGRDAGQEVLRDGNAAGHHVALLSRFVC